jgi:RNA polymerase sigma-70 factor (ECF subfamily)
LGYADFEQTQWSLVLRTRSKDSTLAAEAVARLCEIYWFPVYSYIRRKGNPHHAAQDLAQGFFLKFLENDAFQIADRERGRFRSFLKTSINNYLHEAARRETALKRGGHEPKLSLDYDRADRLYAQLPESGQSPDAMFDKYWAKTVIARCENRLKDECAKRGKPDQFEALQPLLYAAGRHVNFAEAGASLGMTPGATRTAVYRMRRRFGDLVREEVARTIGDPGELDDEIRHLMDALAP